MTINKGSVETYIVEVNDARTTLLELPAGTRYDIYNTDAEAELEDQVPTIDGLTALCVIDSTVLDIGDYDLFLKFTSGADSPVLGPHRFRVVEALSFGP